MSTDSSIEPSSLEQSIFQSECGHSDHEMEYQKTSVEELFGFKNIGLTCYAGAALQCVQVI
jgi:ubiquitin C-terminal hydrolase